MDFLIDAFQPAFMQRALVGGIIAVVANAAVAARNIPTVVFLGIFNEV